MRFAQRSGTLHPPSQYPVSCPNSPHG
jgi:hypothetical protein